MPSATIGAKYLSAPRPVWDGSEKIPLDVSGADGVGLASGLKSYVLGNVVLTGDPIAPTPPPGDNDTSIATTAFVTAAIAAAEAVDEVPSNSSPVMNGVAAPGVLAAYSRGDHVHPVDTSRVAKAGDTMTGDLTISKVSPTISLRKTSALENCQIVSQLGGAVRWSLLLGNAATESGGNSGSNFILQRFDDAGVSIDSVMSIVRSSGIINAAVGFSEAGVNLSAKYGQLAVANTWTQPQVIDIDANLGAALTLRSSEPSNVFSPDLILSRLSASPLINDAMGRLTFQGNNISLAPITYGYIQSELIDPAVGVETARLGFWTTQAGVTASRLRVENGVYTRNAGAGPSGTGDKGVDTINAKALYEDGVRIVDRYGNAQGNLLRRNGGFEIWQRGAGGSASFALTASAGNPYTADGWYVINGANQAMVIAQSAGLTDGSQWCAKVQRNSGQTGTGNISFNFPMDMDELYPALGQFVRLSFTAKAGANYSSPAGAMSVFLTIGTGTPIKVAGFTSATSPINTSVTLTTTAQRFQITTSIVVLTTTHQMEIRFLYAPVGTAGADDSFYIDDVQLEVVADANQQASPFQRLNFQEQLVLCQRHFNKTFKYNIAPAQNVGVSSGELLGLAGKAGALNQYVPYRYPVQMRTNAPTVGVFNPAVGGASGQVRDEFASVDCSATASTAFNDTSLYIGATGNAATGVGNLLGVHLTIDAGI